jgi:hypothetical protein
MSFSIVMDEITGREAFNVMFPVVRKTTTTTTYIHIRLHYSSKDVQDSVSKMQESPNRILCSCQGILINSTGMLAL